MLGVNACVDYVARLVLEIVFINGIILLGPYCEERITWWAMWECG